MHWFMKQFLGTVGFFLYREWLIFFTYKMLLDFRVSVMGFF